MSNATCPTRPHLWHACFVASRVIIMCYILRHFQESLRETSSVRQVVPPEWMGSSLRRRVSRRSLSPEERIPESSRCRRMALKNPAPVLSSQLKSQELPYASRKKSCLGPCIAQETMSSVKSHLSVSEVWSFDTLQMVAMRMLGSRKCVRLHSVSLRGSPSFRTQHLENLSHYL